MSKTREKIWYLKIGNSELALWDGTHRVQRATHLEPLKILQPILKSKSLCTRVYALSVVPKLTRKMNQLFRAHQIVCRWIGVEDLLVSLAYRKGLGVDRACNIAAVIARQKLPAVVIDVGTAMTVDWVDSKAKHLGGWICVTPRLALKSLYENTAQLPLLEFRSKPGLGDSTRQCLLTGQTALIRGIISEVSDEARRRWGRQFYIYATGGGLHTIKLHGVRREPYLGLEALKEMVKRGRIL